MVERNMCDAAMRGISSRRGRGPHHAQKDRVGSWEIPPLTPGTMPTWSASGRGGVHPMLPAGKSGPPSWLRSGRTVATHRIIISLKATWWESPCSSSAGIKGNADWQRTHRIEPGGVSQAFEAAAELCLAPEVWRCAPRCRSTNDTHIPLFSVR